MRYWSLGQHTTGSRRSLGSDTRGVDGNFLPAFIQPLSHFVGGAQATGCHCVVGGRQRGESSIVRGVERIETARVVAAATTRPPPPRRRDPVSASAPALHAPLPVDGQIVPEHRVGSIVRTFVHHKTPKSRPRRVRPTFRSVCSTVLCLVEIRLHPGLVVRTCAGVRLSHIEPAR